MNALHSPKALRLFFIVLTLCALPFLSRAESNSDYDADTTRLESLGLYEKMYEGSLGKDLWHASRRSDITTLIRSMDAAPRTPVQQKLFYGILLTTADINALENDVPPQPGMDLFTLRMEKLIEAGAYEKAFDMYTLLEEPAYHPKLARYGILAMLYSGQKSTACLEANTINIPEPKTAFWMNFTAYCDATLSGGTGENAIRILKNPQSTILYAMATQEDYKFTYTPEKFSSLGTLEKALLTADHKLDLSRLEQITPDNVPPSHIESLLAQNTISEESRTLLTAEAVKWGLKEPVDLQRLYKSSFKNTEDGLVSRDSEPTETWKKPAYYYHVALNAENDSEKWAAVQQAYGLFSSDSLHALTPFAGTVEKIRLENPSLEDIQTAYSILIRAGKSIPPHWAKSIKNVSQDETIKPQYLPLLIIGHLSDPAQDTEEPYKIALMEEIQYPSTNSQFFSKKIIENVDKTPQDGNNALKAYEKDLGLTFGKDYVMPSVDVWDRLIQATNKNAIGEAVLLSSALIHDQVTQDANPALLIGVKQSLENVGLTRISEDLAMTASLGYIK